jgi:hypothetical protein
LRRRKTRTRPLEVCAAALAALCLSGCGAGAKRAAPHPPKLPRDVATSLATRSDAVAAALAAGDGCRALSLARTLQAETVGAINARRVPPRLQEQLSGSVNELVARVTCVPPTPVIEEHGEPQKPKQHGKHGKKHGRGDE